MLKLINEHIIILNELANNFFPNAAQVSWVYYKDRHTLLIANKSDELFKSLHKTNVSILKHKNDKGDRSIAILELLIDNEINQSDRDLKYFADEKMGILSVFFE